MSVNGQLPAINCLILFIKHRLLSLAWELNATCYQVTENGVFTRHLALLIGPVLWMGCCTVIFFGEESGNSFCSPQYGWS